MELRAVLYVITHISFIADSKKDCSPLPFFTHTYSEAPEKGDANVLEIANATFVLLKKMGVHQEREHMNMFTGEVCNRTAAS